MHILPDPSDDFHTYHPLDKRIFILSKRLQILKGHELARHYEAYFRIFC